MIAASTLPDVDVTSDGNDLFAPDMPPTLDGEWTGETIAGYPIHPYASRFPLLEGTAFEEFVESIAATGIEVPVEMHTGLVADGRNRLRAVEVLRERGLDVEVRTVEWQSLNGGTIEESIFNRNVVRRHLSDDQRAVLATEMLPAIRASRAARQHASRFSTRAATADSMPPGSEAQRSPRSSQEKAAASTAGALAKLAGVTHHTAGQAINLFDDIEADIVPSEEMEAVLRGEKPLCRAGRNQRRPKPQKKGNPVSRASAADIFDDPDTDGEAPPVTPETFARAWDHLLAIWPVTEHRDVRALAMVHIPAEQRRFDG